MLVLVTYDVKTLEEGGKKRLRQVARACENFGQRVQFSAFEIEVNPAQWAKLKARLEGIIQVKHDSLRYYYLGSNWERKIEHVGAKPSIDLNGPLIV